MDSSPSADSLAAPSSDTQPPAKPALFASPDALPVPKTLDHPALWLLALAVLSVGASYIPAYSRESLFLGVVFSTTLYVWLVVRLASATGRVFNVPQQRPLPQVLAWCALAIGLWAASEFALRPHLEVVSKSYGEAAMPQWLRLVGLANYTLRPLMLVAGAVCGGVALGRLVKYANMLGPLAGVAALIDVWGVLLGGIVSKLLTSPTSAPIAAKAMAPLPTIGAAHGAGGGSGISIASVGTGDFLFLGLFFGVLWAHRMDARGAQRWIAPLVTLALLAIALDVIPFLPGLLFIGLGAAIPNRKYLVYTREERFALLYAGVFVALLTAGLYFSITSQLK